MSMFKLQDQYFTRLSPQGLVPDEKVSTEMNLLQIEAKELGITCEVIPDSDVYKLTYKNHVEYLRDGAPTSNRLPGPQLCDNKALTRAMLAQLNLPIAKGFTYYRSDSSEYLQEIFSSLKAPLVIKPIDGAHGEGVKLNLTTFSELEKAVSTYFSESKSSHNLFAKEAILIEEMCKGSECRILATKDKVLAVMSRRPASVVGDGIHSIKELIEIKNKDEIRNISQDLYPHIKIDEDMIRILKTNNYTVESIPDKEVTVQLRLVSNIMAGGDAYDLTDEIHPSVASIATKIVTALHGMTFVGIDFMSTDITAEQKTQQHAIIEVNAAPEWAMHDMPMHGKKRHIAKELLILTFPELTK